MDQSSTLRAGSAKKIKIKNLKSKYFFYKFIKLIHMFIFKPFKNIFSYFSSKKTFNFYFY